MDQLGSRRGQWNWWDWSVACWVMFLDWMFELAQWVLSNVVPAFKNGTVQGAILAGLVFGVATLVMRVLRDNASETRARIFPLTPPPNRRMREMSEAENHERGER